MARPIKHNADYFPHNCDLRNDRRCKALRSRFNLEGYAVFIMLLEILANANHFQIENNPMEIELIAGDIDIDAKKLNAILEYLLKLGLLVMEKDVIGSPILDDLKKMLNELRGRDRKRKSENTSNNGDVFQPENPTKENKVFQLENGVIRTENTQSKGKESKGNKRKENEIKEKGNKENQPPIFFNSFLKEENNNANTPLTEKEKNSSDALKEKSSAKKGITDACLLQCEQIFERFARMYVWENKDREQLSMLLQKICITKPDLKTDSELAEAFYSFIQKLPEYWRTKKFTIPNLNYNFNEIVSEIRANKNSPQGKKQIIKQTIVAKQPEIKREPTHEEKQKIRNDFIKSICESYQKFVATGEHGYVPMWIMHDTLIEEKVLKITEKKLEQYRTQAIEARKAELSKPKHPTESRTFRAILENFSEEMEKGNEKNRIDIAVKNLAVQGLFNELKKKQTDIKTLFKK